MANLPSITRRLFLSRAPAVAAAGSLAVAPALAAPIVEADELPELAAALAVAIDAHAVAHAAKVAARAEYERLAPAVPEVLVLRGLEGSLYDGEWECDLDGNNVYHKPAGPRRRIATTNHLERLGWSKAKKGRPAELWKAARAYEAGCASARKASRYDKAAEAAYWAADELRRLADEIIKTPTETASGLSLKGKAIIACRACDGWHNNMYWAVNVLAEDAAALGSAS